MALLCANDQNGLLTPSLEPLLPTGPAAFFIQHPRQLNQGILDVACGPGGWVHQMAHNFDIPVVGFDISEDMIDFAKVRAEKEKLFNAHFRVFDLYNLSKFAEDGDEDPPFAFKGPFDFIQSRLVFWFLSKEEAVQLCRDMIRLLTPTGIIRLVEGFDLVTNSEGLKAWSQALARTMAQKKGVPTHLNPIYNSFLLKTFLLAAGIPYQYETAHIVHYSAGSPNHSHYQVDIEKLLVTMHAEIAAHALPDKDLFQLEEQVRQEVRSEEFFAQQTYSSIWGSQMPL